ncbi:MAG: RdgB/HAM1 family non-canonical purine NTP pyrophosphatase [Saprospiraceae bacterium]|jgi:XTP/dITP diphosphohydrolase|nr:RdgB/HAM1 family non-canonical purine NTP pyrophosphatase [Saprospiraceae bacterium]
MNQSFEKQQESQSAIRNPQSAIIFATGNPNKIREVHELLEGIMEVGGLQDIGCPLDLPETSPTIEGNALQKARYVYENYGVDCFSEDTGLEVEALGGEPGVLSARFAGEGKNAEDNMQLVLEKMAGEENRKARFYTVIALMLGGEEHLFEGIAEGEIRRERSGTGGFGYDPIFQPMGFERTFAELTKEEKNAISHRGKAVGKLVKFLTSLKR